MVFRSARQSPVERLSCDPDRELQTCVSKEWKLQPLECWLRSMMLSYMMSVSSLVMQNLLLKEDRWLQTMDRTTTRRSYVFYLKRLPVHPHRRDCSNESPSTLDSKQGPANRGGNHAGSDELLT